jgi:hypothetical protein
MSTPTIPVSDALHQSVRELAEQTGQSMTDVLAKAVDVYRRKLFFEQLNAGYAALRADPQAWADELEERKLWDATLMDGLDPDERWTNDGYCLSPEGQMAFWTALNETPRLTEEQKRLGSLMRGDS